ncbi:hypothetical protein RhiJN_08641 [Ceratobasidium sp. AG-Ba]|nr:hypothetical protein RhiJN_08641 [Ceratobasidium sp. AG-Ba]QRW09426.1 hypothetical protein RhiLY_08425 [Ceratobasidium sp. AG-Ba]
MGGSGLVPYSYAIDPASSYVYFGYTSSLLAGASQDQEELTETFTPRFPSFAQPLKQIMATTSLNQKVSKVKVDHVNSAAAKARATAIAILTEAELVILEAKRIYAKGILDNPNSRPGLIQEARAFYKTVLSDDFYSLKLSELVLKVIEFKFPQITKMATEEKEGNESDPLDLVRFVEPEEFLEIYHAVASGQLTNPPSASTTTSVQASAQDSSNSGSAVQNLG